MRCFIRVEDGKPVEHPIIEQNFVDSFPHIDIDNLPPEFANFIRIAPPIPGVYEVYEGVTYEWNGSAFTDVHHIRPMTEEEKNVKIEEAKSRKPEDHVNISWRFDEEQCQWIGQALNRPENGVWRFDHNLMEWVPQPEPPYPSWVLSPNGKRWVAPVSVPKDGRTYTWNEDILNWVLKEN